MTTTAQWANACLGAMAGPVKQTNGKVDFENAILTGTKLHWDQKRSGHLGFQFLDFQLKSFVDPKPVELWESVGSPKWFFRKVGFMK